MTPRRKETAAAQKSPAATAAKLLAHPIRIQALTILVDRVASPTEIAREIGESIQLVNYHMKELAKGDAIELMKTVKSGGVDEHFYRAARRPELTHEEWLELSPQHKQELALVGVRNFFAESLASVESESMLRDPQMFLWWKAAALDQEGREEVRREQDAHVARLLEIEARSNARVVQSGAEIAQRPVVLGVWGFDRARSSPVNEVTAKE